MKKFFAFSFFAAAMVAAAVSFVGCKKHPIEVFNPSHVTRIEGTIAEGMDYLSVDGGPYTMKLNVRDMEAYASVTVASCALEANGSFSMGLPESLGPNLLTSYFNEMEGLALSNINIKTSPLQGVELSVYDDDGRLIGDVSYGNQDGWAEMIFADSDCDISGTASFTTDDGFTLNDKYNLNLKRGWNWVYLYDDGPNFDIRTEIPSDARYHLGIYVE